VRIYYKNNKEGNMRTVIAGFFIMFGLVLMAGSGGDCDGKCMENANTLGEVMLYGFIGLMSFIMGSILVIGRE
jgi:hypothetical protein|tara:strand:- start:60 stop:278 length:219 start_codon:yes stop_codon:yes gene_type:complete